MATRRTEGDPPRTWEPKPTRLLNCVKEDPSLSALDKRVYELVACSEQQDGKPEWCADYIAMDAGCTNREAKDRLAALTARGILRWDETAKRPGWRAPLDLHEYARVTTTGTVLVGLPPRTAKEGDDDGGTTTGS